MDAKDVPSLICVSRDMRMMQLSTAGARAKLGLSWRRSGNALPSAVWSFILRRPGSSTARMPLAGNVMKTWRSISWATHSNTTGAKPAGQELRQLPAGDQRQGGQRNPADRPRMADSLDPEQPTARRFGKADRSRGAGMDELLRALLPYEVHRGPAPHQRGSRPMGETEIQAFAISKNRLSTLAGTARRRDPSLLYLWQIGIRPSAGR
jgi:hypothetical protein